MCTRHHFLQSSKTLLQSDSAGGDKSRLAHPAAPPGSACGSASQTSCWRAGWRRTAGWLPGSSGCPPPPPSLVWAWTSYSCSYREKERERNIHYSRIKKFDYRLKTYLERFCFKKHNLIYIGKYPKKLDFLLQCVLLPSQVQTSGNQNGKKQMPWCTSEMKHIKLDCGRL